VAEAVAEAVAEEAVANLESAPVAFAAQAEAEPAQGRCLVTPCH